MKPKNPNSATQRARTGALHPATKLGAIALAWAALQAPANAADFLWKGNWAYWEDANEWTLLGVPGLGDSAELAGGASWISTARGLGRLTLSGGRLWGTGSLTTNTLDFQRGILGGGGLANSFPTGFTTVTGAAWFNGTQTQAIAANHTLTLQGTTTWSAGTGAIGSSGHGGVVVNAAGAVFSDQGAGAANAYKALRDSAGSYTGGTFINNGSYVRTGLGLTRAYGFENNGSLDLQSGSLQLRDIGSSSGQILVAKGSELAFYESTAVVSGQIANQGLVSFDRSNVMLTNTTMLNGEVKILSGQVQNHSSNTLLALEMSGGLLTGTGHLTVNRLDFKSGTLGAGNNGYPTGFTTVTGTAIFDGTQTQAIAVNHTLNLQGASTWTAGSGAIGSSVFGGSVVNAVGATFTDQGAGAANAYKALRDSGGTYSGGTFINQGTYLRTGQGLTRAYGFRNEGLLQLSSGSFGTEVQFSNVGEIRIEAGAKLQSLSGPFINEGLLGGEGSIQTRDLNQALTNLGTLTPGGLGSAGRLLLDGDLTLAAAGALRFDVAAHAHDVLDISSDVSFGGTLQLWADPSRTLHLGDSFVVASYGQRLAGSSFAQIQWLGDGANPFSLEYGEHALTLRVTAAVPEPGAWALWLGGLAAMGGLARRRQSRRG